MSRGGSGYYAALSDPRYAAAESYVAPRTADAPINVPSPERTGVIWGSLFRAYPRSYALFTGGLDSLAEVGNVEHPLDLIGLPYQQGFTRPAQAGPHCFRPRLSAFTNKALGAANADRNQSDRAPMPLPVERTFAVPQSRFWDQFPSNPDMAPVRKHLGYVTNWPGAQMQFQQMGQGG